MDWLLQLEDLATSNAFTTKLFVPGARLILTHLLNALVIPVIVADS